MPHLRPRSCCCALQKNCPLRKDQAMRQVTPTLRRRRVASKTRKVVPWITCLHTDSQPMSVAYLEKLNPEQRRAVEPGVRDAAPPGTPLLVIAGAGSGKTNTLAHR